MKVKGEGTGENESAVSVSPEPHQGEVRVAPAVPTGLANPSTPNTPKLPNTRDAEASPGGPRRLLF